MSPGPELVRKCARAVGAVSYYYRTQAGWLQPEVHFVDDMRVEAGEVQLSPMDGEVKVSLFTFYLGSFVGCEL